MGLKTTSGGGTYVRFKEGKFYRSTDKDNLFTEIEGEIIGLSIANDEYEGKPIKKLIVRMTDGEENFIVSLGFDTSYATNFISFLKNADLSKPLSLVGTYKEGNDGKKKPGVLIKQDDVFLKAFYSKANPNGLPPMVQKKSGKWDKDDMVEFLEDVLLNDLATKVSKTKPVATTATAKAPESKVPSIAGTGDSAEDDDDDDDSLPF